MNLRTLLLCMAAMPLTQTSTAKGPIDYEEREIRGWTVMVHPELATTDNELGAQVLELLDHRLFDIEHVVPSEAVGKLKGVTIWMDLEDSRVPGGVYHPSREWLVGHGYDPRLARGVQFGNAQNFIRWSFDQPWMVLHELAHAYHHQFLGYKDERILAAYTAAKQSGDYEQVLRCSGRTEPAYGMNNEQEYFAELSEAYFGVNDFYPFVKAELREFDDQGFEAVRSAWGK
jgi:hypothetical protein